MNKNVILNSEQFSLTLQRLCYQLIENHDDFKNTVLIGLQPRGVYVANRLKFLLKNLENIDALTGALDITFFRDDFRRSEKPFIPSVTNIDFSIEDKRVVLIDDVLFTGRTVRAGMEAALAFGRPKEIELLTFIDRRFKRNIPIQPDYIGKSVDTIEEERVSVNWQETEGKDQVLLLNKEQ